MAEVILLPTLKDNYTYILRGLSQSEVAVVDPGESKQVFEWCEQNNAKVSSILCTHHHHDHVGGVGDIKSRFNSQVWCSAYDKNRISAADHALKDGDFFAWQGLKAKVLEIPGHTLGHIAFFFEREKWLFCGDTLFTLGCGRLFEGTAEQMYHSLTRLKELPAETKIYCGHEYTLSNARFALSVEASNVALIERVNEAKITRDNGLPTVPSTMAEEINTNPFLRARDQETFRQLRLAKDSF